MSKIYQLKITLKNIKPPIWRRVEVPADIRLDELHSVIQHVMGWFGGHMHSFEFGREEYFGDEESLEDIGGKPTWKTKLNKVLSTVKQKGLYTYDFGDDWEHEILLEKILDAQPDTKYPRCTDGKRACPPEDCGGPWGYADLLETLKDPKHPEHAEMLEWVGGELDPEEFDVEEVNEGWG